MEADETVRRYSEVRPQLPEWVIPGRVPKGELTVLAGVPKVGKSLLTTRWAADLSNEGYATWFASLEDSAAFQIWWRLKAANARMELVYDPLEYPVFNENGVVSEFEDRLRHLVPTPTLVVLDPFLAMMDVKLSSNNDQHVRAILAPLARLAGRLQLAIVVVLHVNKAHGIDSLRRIGGSIGLQAAPRSVLVLGKDNLDEQGSPRRILRHEACNVASESETQEWVISSIWVEHEGMRRDVPRLDYNGLTNIGIERLLGEVPSEEDKTERDEAREFLEKALVIPRKPREVIKEAEDLLGVSRRTVYNAMHELGVIAEGQGKAATWKLPYVT